MNASAFQLRQSIAPAAGWAMLLLRWLLVLIIAVDLISSPFHAHHHESGPEGYSEHASQLDEPVDFSGQASPNDERHVDSDHVARGAGHSMSALQGSSIQLAGPDSAPKLLALISVFVLFGLVMQSVAEALVRWRPGRERVQIPFFRTVPPDGRAPPHLHV